MEQRIIKTEIVDDLKALQITLSSSFPDSFKEEAGLYTIPHNAKDFSIEVGSYPTLANVILIANILTQDLTTVIVSGNYEHAWLTFAVENVLDIFYKDNNAYQKAKKLIKEQKKIKAKKLLIAKAKAAGLTAEDLM